MLEPKFMEISSGINVEGYHRLGISVGVPTGNPPGVPTENLPMGILPGVSMGIYTRISPGFHMNNLSGVY